MAIQTAQIEKSLTNPALARELEPEQASPIITSAKQMSIGQFLGAQKKQIAAALPKHLNPDRLLRIAMTEIRKNPKLSQCTQVSLIGSILQAAQLGLEPGPQGHCYLIPFDRSVKVGKDWKKIPECQFMIGYRGMLDLVYRTARINSISVHEVRENDHYKYSFGINEVCDHTPFRGDRGEITDVYIVVRFKDGAHFFDSMTTFEVNEIRDKSISYAKWIKDGKTGSAPIWHTNYPEMCKKSIIRRSYKWLPSSIELQSAIALDEAADRGEQDNSYIFEGEFENAPDKKESRAEEMARLL